MNAQRFSGPGALLALVRPLSALPALLALLALLGSAPAAQAEPNDYPTADRVVYVQECMRTHPGPYFEMVNKCSCVIDKLASQVNYEEFVAMQTISNGMSIGGERGNVIRDTPSLQPELKKYRELQAQDNKSCFINEPK